MQMFRREFAVSYNTDKWISTFFGRPPRLQNRYCTCRPPYDLSDEEVIAPTDMANLAISRLDSLGWNQNGTIHRQTLARIGLTLNIILEEALELSLVAPISDLDQSEKAQ